MSVAEAKSKTESSLTSVIPALKRLGLLERFNRPVDRIPAERTERFVRVDLDRRCDRWTIGQSSDARWSSCGNASRLTRIVRRRNLSLS